MRAAAAPTQTPQGTRPVPATGRVPWRRHLPRWLGLLALVAVLGTVFVRLGLWQLDRLQERRANNEVILAHEAAPAVPWESVFDHPITDADAWQRVTVTGTFDADHQFVVRYRSNAGQVGYEIVTPLRTASGRTVLVDRGFVIKPANEDYPAVAPAPPSGQVSVVGHVRRDEQGDATAVNPDGTQVRLINSQALSAVLPYELASGYIGLLSVTPGQEGDFVPVATPEISDGPHFWYAVQWFLFAGLAFGGLVTMVTRDVRESRAQSPQEDPDGPAPD